MATLLKGKPVVDSMAEDMRARIAALGEQGVVPTLALLVRSGQPLTTCPTSERR